MSTVSDQPIRERVLMEGGLIGRAWMNWLFELSGRADASPQVPKTVALTAQAATISTTPIPLPAISEGLYRLTWYLRVTQAATVSSSATVTLSWTDGNVSCAFVGPAVTGNTTDTVQSQTFTLGSDASSPLSYAIAYASVGAAPMQFRFSLVVETMPS